MDNIMDTEQPNADNVNPVNVTEDYRNEVRLALAVAIANSPNRYELERAIYRYGEAAAATAERRAIQGHGEAVLRWGHFANEMGGIVRRLWEDFPAQPEVD